MLKKKKDPEETFTRHDKRNTASDDAEDAAIKARVEGNKDAAKIKKAAEKIEQGP